MFYVRSWKNSFSIKKWLGVYWKNFKVYTLQAMMISPRILPSAGIYLPTLTTRFSTSSCMFVAYSVGAIWSDTKKLYTFWIDIE
jgi:hypothetical protein